MLVARAHRLLSESSLIVRTHRETGRLHPGRRIVRRKSTLNSGMGVECQ
jgi:hypothetical protein